MRNTALTCFEVFSFFQQEFAILMPELPLHLMLAIVILMPELPSYFNARQFIILRVSWNVCYKFIFKTILELKSLFNALKNGVCDLFTENENYFL